MEPKILIKAVVEKDNLNQAYLKVVRNKGAQGIDGMKYTELKAHLKDNGEEIKEQILTRKYQPKPVKRVEIPKPDGSMRKLGIPTVTDRFVQQAVAQVLTPIYEPQFHEQSYGFRPGKNAKQAIQKALEYMNQGYRWIVDIDLEKFFDTVNHDKLISLLTKTIKDGNMISLIRKFLVSGIMVGEKLEESEIGTPQGGNLSPLLANIMLNELDWELEKRGLRFVRYADDCIIMVRSRKAANRVMEHIKSFIEKKLLLKVNVVKSKIARPWEIKYLGFGFYYNYKEKLFKARPHEKAVEKLKQKLKTLTKRSWSVSNSYKAQKINEVIRGWVNYYKISSIKTLCKKMDAFIRYRFRMCIWKHWKNPRTRCKRLMQLGVGEHAAHCAAWMQGYARVCRGKAVCFAMSNARLEKFGLIPMEKYFGEVTC